jgi:hypothetical protein
MYDAQASILQINLDNFPSYSTALECDEHRQAFLGRRHYRFFSGGMQLIATEDVLGI